MYVWQSPMHKFGTTRITPNRGTYGKFLARRSCYQKPICRYIQTHHARLDSSRGYFERTYQRLANHLTTRTLHLPITNLADSRKVTNVLLCPVVTGKKASENSRRMVNYCRFTCWPRTLSTPSAYKNSGPGGQDIPVHLDTVTQINCLQFAPW